MKNLLNPEGIAAGSLPATVRNKSFMINDCPAGIKLAVNLLSL